jgi:putative membrane protein
MKKFIIRLLINAVALFAAVAILRDSGIHAQDTNWLSFLWLALIFGLVNALIKPVLKFLTCPLIILTLGLGTLLINTLMFWLAGYIGTSFGIGFTVDGFMPAFLGALIVSVVSIFLSALLRDEMKNK